MNTILKQLLTESDNTTHDLVRWMAFIAFLVGIGMEVYSVIHQVPFDLQSYGIAVGAMISGLGLSLKLKSGNETPPQ